MWDRHSCLSTRDRAPARTPPHRVEITDAHPVRHRRRCDRDRFVAAGGLSRHYVECMHALALLLLATTLRGRVTMDGNPLPGVTITVNQCDGVRQTVSDFDGRYYFT